MGLSRRIAGRLQGKERIAMMVTRLAVGMLMLFGVGFWSAPQLAAQVRAGMGPMMYDTKSEVVLKGTVDEVKAVSGMMMGGERMRGGGPEQAGPQGRGMPGRGMQGMGMQGTHLVLKTSEETIEVHLGPSVFLKEQGIEIAKDDVVEIVGSRVKIGESAAVLAREIRKGEASWRLRDAEGRPLWRRMQRGRR
jgi:hypothetical protein